MLKRCWFIGFTFAQIWYLNLEIKKGFKNIVTDHFSCPDLKFISESLLLNEFFHDKQIMSVNDVPWFADIVYYLAICQIPEH